MLFQLRNQLWPFGVLDRNEILNAHGIEHLTAKTFSDNTGANALARRINRCRCARWTAADDQDFKRLLGCDLSAARATVPVSSLAMICAVCEPLPVRS